MVSTPGPPMCLMIYTFLPHIYVTEYELDWRAGSYWEAPVHGWGDRRPSDPKDPSSRRVYSGHTRVLRTEAMIGEGTGRVENHSACLLTRRCPASELLLVLALVFSALVRIREQTGIKPL